MADLLALSSRIIDEGVAHEPVNRITQELSELAPDLALVESFSHVVAFRTDAGLVLFDTSSHATGAAVVQALRRWSDARFHTLLYTHGHVDHVGGAGFFVADEVERGRPAPRVVGHENVAARFARYRATNGYNLAINARQFGSFARAFAERPSGDAPSFLPRRTPAPDLGFRDRMQLRVGGLEIELRHARGETDDHLWAWLPQRKTLCAGDFFIWNFPNAGNPQKAQRYPLEWAAALREMAGMGAELFLPAHGLPIAGVERIRRVLGDVAEALEALKPAPDAALAREWCALAGGVERLVQRARELADAGDFRLACHLVESAVQAAPGDKAAHATRAEIYRRRRQHETSLMALGIYGAAARESERIAADAEEAG